MTRIPPIVIKKAVLHRLAMRLKAPFATSFGTIANKEFFIAELIDETGCSGFGESVSLPAPVYSEETVTTNEHMLRDFLLPLVFQAPIGHPDALLARFAPIRRNPMAKSIVDCAVWDLYARRLGVPLATALGGRRKTIDVGVSIGIQPSVEALLAKVEESRIEGYKRVKIKIKPGWDLEPVKAVRERYPQLPLMADANSAYTLEDMERLRKLDEYELMMIEQPLGHDDIVDHARLQRAIRTPICLDESIHSLEDARKAIELGSCKIINIKLGRVGGLSESIRIHDYCERQGVPVWCGGMLEAGVGRAHNVALTTLSQFVLPGDTAASSRYWEQDIIAPEVTVKDGVIEVPDRPGIGYDVDRKAMERFTLQRRVIEASG
ncbi:o-succinylbenzoate synthase [Paenibacillus cymbidii]|uniref:o-succinylbenzoate synthase n=1 Tax=Paenibacillus cymbidii TaxID=1639034 RepID=UPI001080F0EE|nr:o-succinylbenzoate synthase [Paenibacillus cymbidii]